MDAVVDGSPTAEGEDRGGVGEEPAESPGGRGSADVRQRLDDPPVGGGVPAGVVEQPGEATVPGADDRPAQGSDSIGVDFGEVGIHQGGERGRRPGVEC
ncbi:MAG TPA: hypothetical protein DIW82_08055, partial [Corynebacterium nuruki]|nr:hypothetical protein [Corynebacterium nuruki]